MAGLNALPVPPTPFIGRAGDLDDVRQLIVDPSVRVVSLLGAPGVGKTRLAIEAARAVEPEFPDGVAFVSLAEVRDPGGVASAIVLSLGLDDVGVGPALSGAVGHLGDKRLLLVVDNVEHVVEAAPDLAELVARCGHLTILATSRRPLAIRAEHCLNVPTLSLPAVDATLGEIERSDAVSLLVQRIRAANRAVVVGADAGPVLADICRSLDGLPLALELIAARARALPLTAVRDALRSRLPLLRDGDRDLPARQRTMHDAIAWSYELLDEASAAVLRRMSVFVGGADVAAVVAVTDDLGLAEAEVIDVLVGLASHSLLVVASIEGAPRFQLLEVVREFATGMLAAVGDGVAVGQRHAEHFLVRAETAAPHLVQPDQAEWLERVHRVPRTSRMRSGGQCGMNLRRSPCGCASPCGSFGMCGGHCRKVGRCSTQRCGCRAPLRRFVPRG